MTITVTKHTAIGAKSYTTTASADMPVFDTAMYPGDSGDEAERQTIIRITRALIEGMEPPRYVRDEEGNVAAEVML